MGAGAATFGQVSPLVRLGYASTVDSADHYYLFCYFAGGWDILLSLDPRDPMVFTPGAIQSTGIYPGYEHLIGTDGQLQYSSSGEMFGPYMTPLMPWLDHMTIIRGMSMETLTHAAGMRRFLTGRPPSGLQARGSSAATWLAAATGESEAIPNLSLGVESYNVDQPNFASGLKVNSLADLILALQAGDPALHSLQEAQLNALLSQFAMCESQSSSPFIQSAQASRIKAAEMVAANYASEFDIMQNNDPLTLQIRDNFGIVGNVGVNSREAQAAAAVIALMSGMTRVASVRVAANLDTHFEDNWTEDQGPNQEQGFQIIAAMMKTLNENEYKGSGSSWLDHTTIVGFSEFSRTALLNGNMGRDHSLTNACFLAGGDIKGGQIIGRSSDVGMIPTPTNLTTGISEPGGEIIRPEHIHAALLSKVGLTDKETDLRVEPLTAIFKS